MGFQSIHSSAAAGPSLSSSTSISPTPTVAPQQHHDPPSSAISTTATTKKKSFITRYFCLIMLVVLLTDQFYRHTRLLLKLSVVVAPTPARSSSDDGSNYDNRDEEDGERDSGERAERGFGACLMVKQDNQRLYEWIAYHYTVLPLRYVVIGSDVNNTEDPNEVLKLWTSSTTTSTNLKYWILNATEFSNFHGGQPYYGTNNNTTHKSRRRGGVVTTTPDDQKKKKTKKQVAHEALIHRQKGFISACLQLLKRQQKNDAGANNNLKWVALTDTDEFIVMNRVLENDNSEGDTNTVKMMTAPGSSTPPYPAISNNWSSYYHRMRKRYLPPLNDNSNVTVLDVLEKIQQREQQREHHPNENNNNETTTSSGTTTIGSCYTMPRLTIGSLENRSCSQQQQHNNNDDDGYYNNTSYYNNNRKSLLLSTLRFVQHGPIGDFGTAGFGKVLLDLSRLDDELVSHQVPKNIHRPYVEHCRYPFVQFSESYFYVQHYLGDWNMYVSRTDDRRNRHEFERRAYLDALSSSSENNNNNNDAEKQQQQQETYACQQGVYRWFPRFVERFGSERAKVLLGGAVT